MLFESFSTSFNATSWPTYLSMPCEVALKSVKKSFKNQIFPVLGQLLRTILRWSHEQVQPEGRKGLKRTPLPAINPASKVWWSSVQR
jgi:hypothetical protein